MMNCVSKKVSRLSKISFTSKVQTKKIQILFNKSNFELNSKYLQPVILKGQKCRPHRPIGTGYCSRILPVKVEI